MAVCCEAGYDHEDLSQTAAMLKIEPQPHACKSNYNVISCSPYTTTENYDQLLLALCHGHALPDCTHLKPYMWPPLLHGSCRWCC